MREEAPPLPLGLSEGSEPKTEAKFLLHGMNKMDASQKAANVNWGNPICDCCKQT